MRPTCRFRLTGRRMAGASAAVWIVLAGAFASGLAMPCPVHAAQDGDADQASDTIPRYQLPRIIVAPRRVTLSSGGASVVTLPLQTGRVSPSPNLADVLRDAPLVQIRTNSRGEEQPSLRGAGSRQVAVLFDGVPLTLGWDHRTDLSVVPLQGAASLTIHRGLSSLLHGPNILGGVVEVTMAESLRGGSDEASPERPRPGPSTRMGGTLEHGGAWRLDANGRAGFRRGRVDWTIRGGLGARRSSGELLPPDVREAPGLVDSYVADADGLRLNSDVERVQGFLSLRADGADGVWGAVNVSGHDTQRGVPPEAHTAEPRFWRYPDQNEVILSLSGGREWEEQSARPAAISATLGLQLGDTELDAFENEAYRTTVERQRDEDATTTLRVSGRLGDPAATVVRGAFTFADVFHREGEPGGPAEAFGQRLWSLGSEIETPLPSVGPLVTPRVGGGLVWDGASTPLAGPWDPEGDLHALGARAGVSFLLGGSGDFTAHGALSRRARIPSLREMYSGALGRFLPNPDLGPEVQIAAEAGLTARLGAAELQGLTFFQEVEDGIVRVSVEHEGRQVLQRMNRDRVQARGFEFLASLPTDRIEFEADLTLQRVRLRAGPGVQEERAEYEPGISGSVSAATSLARIRGSDAAVGGPAASGVPLGDPRFTAEYRYVGTQHCLDPALGEMERIDASGRLDLRTELPLEFRSRHFRSLVVVARARNVTNALSFDQCGLPRPGRTFELSVQIP
ncbi:MAG: TonB-dependent receptor plug domain-containing protein [Gemmatimonadota bacterium]